MHSGRCFCRKIHWHSTAMPIWQGFCHCESCRRATSAPIVAWMGFAGNAVTFSAPVREYASSEGVIRGFCSDCGAPMFFKSSKWPDEIHLYAASLDAPNTAAPTTHYFHSERLGWMNIADSLERKG